MIPMLADDRCVLFHGDSAKLGDVLPPNSVDAIVSDPPAGIGFMNKEWDGDKGGRDQWIAWLAELLRPAFEALKPGGHALLWAIPRTSHWTAMALELAGFEIRDVHHHIFGTGFPKSLTSKSAAIPDGAGTALKPAVEHWILARKPLNDTVANVFAEHGTGVLNIDACRIGSEGGTRATGEQRSKNLVYGEGMGGQPYESAGGRWPAHLSLEHAPGCTVTGTTTEARDVYVTTGVQNRETKDPDNIMRMGSQVPAATVAIERETYACAIGCPVRMLDEQSGALGGLSGSRSDKGGASRFFYIAKSPRKEKDAGLDHLTPRTGGEATGRADDSAGVANPRAGAGRTGGARNFHPTVKSIELMRWLIRLITPPGGLVLDMFAGSGTTGVAALAEGCTFVGVEFGEEYIPIVVGRLTHALKSTGPANTDGATPVGSTEAP